MAVVSYSKGVGSRKEVDNSWICFIFESILTSFFIKIPYLDSFRTTRTYNSGVERINISNFLSMSSQMHYFFHLKLLFLVFYVVDYNLF